MPDYPKFAVFTIEQLKAAANEISLTNHNFDAGEIYKILCKWTKEVPGE